jgi:hypothetical protein
MLLPPDRIQGLRRGNAMQFLSYIAKRGAVGPYREWVEEVDRLCRVCTIDPVIVWFQADVETNSFKSAEWLRGNTTGLTILGDPLIPNDGLAAALVHVATLWAVLGKVQFPKALHPARHQIAPNWLGYLLHDVARDVRSGTRPPVETVEDLCRKYYYQPVSPKFVWSSDPQYANTIAARAMTSGMHIPNQQYLHRVTPFMPSKVIRVTHPQPVYEGPGVGNRVLGRLEPGQQFAAAGYTTGHAARGIAKWYVMEGPTFGYVHSFGTQEG